MIKRAVNIVVAICIVFNILSFQECSASEEDYTEKAVSVLLEAINPSDDELIYRGDCVAVIMKAIGVTLQENVICSFYNHYSSKVYSEQTVDRANDGYIIIAYEGGVVQGRNGWSLYNESVFEPFEYVTYKECLAMALRCLREPSEIKWNNIEEYAYESGIITGDELNGFDENKKINYAQFKTILSRMLKCKRYLYYAENVDAEQAEKQNASSHLYVDRDSEHTYLDWILNEGKSLKSHWISDIIFRREDSVVKAWTYGMGLTPNIDFRSLQTSAKYEVYANFKENYDFFEYVKDVLAEMTENVERVVIKVHNDKSLGVEIYVDDGKSIESLNDLENLELIERLSELSRELKMDMTIQTSKNENHITFLTLWEGFLPIGFVYCNSVPELKNATELTEIKKGWYYYRGRYIF